MSGESNLVIRPIFFFIYLTQTHQVAYRKEYHSSVSLKLLAVVVCGLISTSVVCNF